MMRRMPQQGLRPRRMTCRLLYLAQLLSFLCSDENICLQEWPNATNTYGYRLVHS